MSIFKSRRFWLMAGVLAALAFGSGILVSKPWAGTKATRSCPDLGDPGGPLQMESSSLTWSAYQITEVRHPVGYRQLVTCNVSDQPLTLRKAWPVHLQPGLKLLGIYTVEGINPRDTELDFPPAGGSPLAGKTVEPDEIVNIDVGTALPVAGKPAFRGLAVEYTVGNKSYTKVFDVSIRLCGPTKEFSHPNSCSTPFEDAKDGCLLSQDPTPDSHLPCVKKTDN